MLIARVHACRREIPEQIIIQARTLGDLTGSIELYAHGGSTHVAGTLDASAPNGGNGGFIETSGDQVRIADTANITSVAPRGRTGTWLIDPDGFTIAAKGGDMTGLTLNTQLAKNNVEIESTQGSGSDGNIYVNDPVLWSANTKLTLTATQDIYINRSITATGRNAGLALNFGGDYHILTPASFSGAEPDADGKPLPKQAPPGTEYAKVTLRGDKATLAINDQAYTLIHSMEQLAALDDQGGRVTGGAVSGHFALAEDLDGASFSRDPDNYASGAVIHSFDGTFAGLGHTVSNLRFNIPQEPVGTGIQSAAFIRVLEPSSLVRDLGVLNVDYTSGDGAGGVVNLLIGSTIQNCYATGRIKARSAAGGFGHGRRQRR